MPPLGPSEEELLHFAWALQLKGGEKFGAPVHTAQFEWGRLGPTSEEARILKAKLNAIECHSFFAFGVCMGFGHPPKLVSLVQCAIKWHTTRVSGPWYPIHTHVMGHL